MANKSHKYIYAHSIHTTGCIIKFQTTIIMRIKTNKQKKKNVFLGLGSRDFLIEQNHKLLHLSINMKCAFSTIQTTLLPQREKKKDLANSKYFRHDTHTPQVYQQ